MTTFLEIDNIDYQTIKEFRNDIFPDLVECFRIPTLAKMKAIGNKYRSKYMYTFDKHLNYDIHAALSFLDLSKYTTFKKIRHVLASAARSINEMAMYIGLNDDEYVKGTPFNYSLTERAGLKEKWKSYVRTHDASGSLVENLKETPARVVAHVTKFIQEMSWYDTNVHIDLRHILPEFHGTENIIQGVVRRINSLQELYKFAHTLYMLICNNEVEANIVEVNKDKYKERVQRMLQLLPRAPPMAAAAVNTPSVAPSVGVAPPASNVKEQYIQVLQDLYNAMNTPSMSQLYTSVTKDKHVAVKQFLEVVNDAINKVGSRTLQGPSGYRQVFEDVRNKIFYKLKNEAEHFLNNPNMNVMTFLDQLGKVELSIITLKDHIQRGIVKVGV